MAAAAQDGKMIVWNAMNTYKVQNISLRSQWVMTCAFEQGNKAVASGGLDNVCTVYQVGGDAGGKRGGKELIGYAR